MEARLKSAIWIKALIRRCDLAAIPVAVLARGDDDADVREAMSGNLCRCGAYQNIGTAIQTVRGKR